MWDTPTTSIVRGERNREKETRQLENGSKNNEKETEKGDSKENARGEDGFFLILIVFSSLSHWECFSFLEKHISIRSEMPASYFGFVCELKRAIYVIVWAPNKQGRERAREQSESTSFQHKRAIKIVKFTVNSSLVYLSGSHSFSAAIRVDQNIGD